MVSVRDGYGRNYLLPRGFAVPATEKDEARMNHEKRVIAARAAKMAKELQSEVDKLSQVSVSISRSVGEGDKLYRFGQQPRHRGRSGRAGPTGRQQEDPARRAPAHPGHDRGRHQAGPRRRCQGQGLGRQEGTIDLRDHPDANDLCVFKMQRSFAF